MQYTAHSANPMSYKYFLVPGVNKRLCWIGNLDKPMRLVAA